MDCCCISEFFFFQGEDGIRVLGRVRGVGGGDKEQGLDRKRT